MPIGAILAALAAAGSGIASGASAGAGAISSLPGLFGQIPGLLGDLGGGGEGGGQFGGGDILQLLLQQGMGGDQSMQQQPQGQAPFVPVQTQSAPQQQPLMQNNAPDLLELLTLLGGY